MMRLHKHLRGSATIEMAYLLPMFLILFVLLMSLSFYFHDKCVLYATAHEVAVVGAQKERTDRHFSESELVDYFYDRAMKKFIFFSEVDVSVEKGLEYFTVEACAIKNNWQIHAKGKAMLMRTEEMIYLKEQLQGGGGDE